MTTTEATTRAIEICPDRTVICTEQHHSEKHADCRSESFRCQISIHPAIEGDAACQQFNGPSFENCLEQLTIAKGIKL